jgi:hypothetical protein
MAHHLRKDKTDITLATLTALKTQFYLATLTILVSKRLWKYEN